jgi:hypothetical protein
MHPLATEKTLPMKFEIDLRGTVPILSGALIG